MATKRLGSLISGIRSKMMSTFTNVRTRAMASVADLSTNREIMKPIERKSPFLSSVPFRNSFMDSTNHSLVSTKSKIQLCGMGLLDITRHFSVSSSNHLWYHPKKLSETQLLYLLHYSRPKRRTKRRHPLEGNPQLKGVVLKTLIKKPKKPNSANRKCVLVRLSNGKEAVAYIPGEGHNLQEHNIVLVRGGRTQDVPGLRLKVIRGKYDCAHVIKKKKV